MGFYSLLQSLYLIRIILLCFLRKGWKLKFLGENQGGRRTSTPPWEATYCLKVELRWLDRQAWIREFFRGKERGESRRGGEEKSGSLRCLKENLSEAFAHRSWKCWSCVRIGRNWKINILVRVFMKSVLRLLLFASEDWNSWLGQLCFLKCATSFFEQEDKVGRSDSFANTVTLLINYRYISEEKLDFAEKTILKAQWPRTRKAYFLLCSVSTRGQLEDSAHYCHSGQSQAWISQLWSQREKKDLEGLASAWEWYMSLPLNHCCHN